VKRGATAGPPDQPADQRDAAPGTPRGIVVALRPGNPEGL